MIFSFLVYSITAGALAYLGWHANAREQRVMEGGGKPLPFYCWEMIASILLFAFVAGARYKTGYDYMSYYFEYKRLCNIGHFNRNDFEPGFWFITYLFAMVKAHEFFYFAFWGGLQLGLFYFAFRDNKSLLPWLALVIMLGGYFVGWMNSIRQVVVECAFIAMIPMCKNWRKYLVACLLSLLLSTIHFTGLFIPLFLGMMMLMRGVRLNRYVMLGIFLLCIALGIYPIWVKALAFLPTLLEGTHLNKYGTMLASLSSGEMDINNWGPNRIMVVVSQLMILWYYPVLKQYYSNNPHFDSFYGLAFVGACMHNLFINTSHYMMRPFEYLILVVAVIIAHALCMFFNTKRYVPLAVLSVVSLGVIYVAVIKAVYVPTKNTIPYLYNSIFCQV